MKAEDFNRRFERHFEHLSGDSRDWHDRQKACEGRKFDPRFDRHFGGR